MSKKPSCWRIVVDRGREIGAVFEDSEQGGKEVYLPSSEDRSFLARNLNLGLSIFPPTPHWIRKLLRRHY